MLMAPRRRRWRDDHEPAACSGKVPSSGGACLRLRLRPLLLRSAARFLLAAGRLVRRLALAAVEQGDAVAQLVLERAVDAAFEQGQDRDLLGPQVREVVAQLALDLLLDLEQQLAF